MNSIQSARGGHPPWGMMGGGGVLTTHEPKNQHVRDVGLFGMNKATES